MLLDMGIELGSPSGEEQHDIEVERFARRTVTIGFEGGQEKTVEYDSKQDTSECETHFRQYVEANRDGPNSQRNLSELARKRNVFTIADRNHVSYRQFEGLTRKYLVSWNDGETVRIVEEDELDNIMDAAASTRDRSEQEEAERASERVDIALDDEPDTDIPEDEPQDEIEPEEIEPEPEEEPEEEYDTDIPEPVGAGS